MYEIYKYGYIEFKTEDIDDIQSYIQKYSNYMHENKHVKIIDISNNRLEACLVVSIYLKKHNRNIVFVTNSHLIYKMFLDNFTFNTYINFYLYYDNIELYPYNLLDSSMIMNEKSINVYKKVIAYQEEFVIRLDKYNKIYKIMDII